MRVTVNGVRIFFDVVGVYTQTPSQLTDKDAPRFVPSELLTYRRYAKCGHGAYRDVPTAFDEVRKFIEA
jgi:hypothetical protein